MTPAVVRRTSTETKGNCLRSRNTANPLERTNMARLSQKYVAYEDEDDDRDYAETDSVYLVDDQKCPWCPRLCFKRKFSTKSMATLAGQKSAPVKPRCKLCCCACCSCSRCCLIKGAIITLSALTVLLIVAVLLWTYALPVWIGMYLKATNISFDYVSLSDNLPDGTKSTNSLLMGGEAR